MNKRPRYRAEFETNFQALRDDLLALDLKIQKTVGKTPDQLMFASHPGYHYVARRYQLKLEDLQ